MAWRDVLAASGEAPPAFLGPTAALVVTAAIIGYVMTRLRVVPIVGFLVAGVLIGPAQLGVVANGEAVQSVAEVGVILLLFTIGIEFSLDRLARVWSWIALGGALQVLLATGVGLGLTTALGGGWRDGVFTGCLLALSSTAIVLKLLRDRGEQSSRRGQLALAVLIAQDLAVVAMALVVPMLGSGTGAAEEGAGAGPLLWAGLTAVAVVAVVLVVARRLMPPLLDVVARTCSPEVFLLTVVAICFGTAYLTALFGVSVSLGAFLAGLMVSESRASTQAFAEVLPLQILFSAVFFVSVGMLLDLRFVADNLLLVVGGSVLVLAVKTATTAAAVAALRMPWRTALATGLLLAQVGEFSFVLLTLGTAAGLAPLGLGGDGSQTVVAVTVALMVATPLLAALGARIDEQGAQQGGAAGPDAPPARAGDEVAEHVVLLGWGPTALQLADTLRQLGTPVLMVTLNPGGAQEAASAGLRVLRGDPAKAHVLRAAGVPQARLVVVSEDQPERALQVVSAARPLTRAPIVARPLGPADVGELAEAGADHVVDHDRAATRALTASVLQRLGHHRPQGSGRRTVVDTSRVVRYPWPSGTGCEHAAMSRPVLPLARGCVDCLREGTEWVHLRVCLWCGYVGCCDSSPRRHARGHAAAEEHPLVASAEPGETWGYCFVDDVTVAEPADVARASSMPPR